MHWVRCGACCSLSLSPSFFLLSLKGIDQEPELHEALPAPKSRSDQSAGRGIQGRSASTCELRRFWGAGGKGGHAPTPPKPSLKSQVHREVRTERVQGFFFVSMRNSRGPHNSHLTLVFISVPLRPLKNFSATETVFYSTNVCLSWLVSPMSPI